MKLTVLGKYGPYPGPGGACSGYLIESDATRVLVDCGSGVLSRLQQVCALKDLDGVILSHLHSDHMSDMLVFRYALDILRMRGLYHREPLPVYLPQNPKDEYDRIAAFSAFRTIPVTDAMEMTIGSLSFTFKEMTHPVQSFGLSVSDGKKRGVYTGDTNYNDHIVDFARDADFFWADTGLLKKDKIDGNAPHLTADEVGRIAKEASVKALMLTHIWPGYAEADLAVEARCHYAGLIVAEELKTYSI